MEKNYEKRFLTKDGNTRISIYREEYPENPRYNTDEPLHCEDWSRNYSIMDKKESDSSSKSARKLLEYMLNNYGDYTKIINALVENGKHMRDGKSLFNNALVYNASSHNWTLFEYVKWYGKEEDWHVCCSMDGKKYDIDTYELLDCVNDDTIDYLIEHCMTDGVKMASYGFCYNGEVSFYDSVSCDSTGICWFEKKEFLKYSGNGEEYWKSKTFLEMDWLHEEIEAWSEGYVYGFEVENLIKSIVNKRYTNVDKDDEEYEEEEWEQTDSCWGFYGDIWKKENLNNIVEQAGFEMEELEEVA